MRWFTTLLVAAFTLIASHSAFADEMKSALDLDILSHESTWTNQSGSMTTLKLSRSSQPYTYNVSGVYINNASTFKCKGTPYPVSGVYYANSGMISLNVAWSSANEDCGSVTGWTGYIVFNNASAHMITDWNLVFTGAVGPQITRGKDTFTLNVKKMSKNMMSN